MRRSVVPLRWLGSAAVAMSLCGLVILAPVSGTRAQDSASPTAWTAAIHAGTCAYIGADPLHRLADLRLGADLEDDDDDDDLPRGQIGGANVLPVAASQTEIDARVEELAQLPHVVVIGDSDVTAGGVLACGEIGGVGIDDDDVAFGLAEQNGSGYFGIGVLDDDDDDDDLEITLLVATPAGTVAPTGATSGTSRVDDDDDDDNDDNDDDDDDDDDDG